MKKLMVFILFLAAAVNAEDTAGPKGGKFLQKGELRAEFVVNSAKLVELYFYDADMNPVMPTEQTARVIAAAGPKKTYISMTDTLDRLIAAEPLPEPTEKGYRIVVQIKAEKGGRFTNFSIDYAPCRCDDCTCPRYACSCTNE